METLTVNFSLGTLVRKGGLEPPRPLGHRILNPARIPVPPLPHRIDYTSSWPVSPRPCIYSVCPKVCPNCRCSNLRRGLLGKLDRRQVPQRTVGLSFVRLSSEDAQREVEATQPLMTSYKVFRYSSRASVCLFDRLVPYVCPWFPLPRRDVSNRKPSRSAAAPWVTNPTLTGS